MSEPKAAIRPEDSLAKMMASLKEKTGKSLEEWRTVIEEAGWQKHGEIMLGLKGQYGVGHAYANQIALRARESEPVSDPIAAIFEKRPDAKAIYEFLLPKIESFGPDIDLAPKKGYVSVRRKKQFAILQPAAARLDVGIQLKDMAPGGRLEGSGSFNAMLSQRVKVATVAEIDDQLIEWLKAAYNLAG